ncbi:transposase [Streptomyces sp. NPDC093600]|uniref:transposase n=1 Tax=Streptomyces sp. NPDC093600 TaxID=3366047 RepID=UPI003814FD8E
MPASSRRRSRYSSDTKIAEWALIEPLSPVPAYRTKTGGHPEKWPRRDFVDAIRHIVDNGAKWRALPAVFPPWETCSGPSGGETRPGWWPTSATSCIGGSVRTRVGALTRSR